MVEGERIPLLGRRLRPISFFVNRLKAVGAVSWRFVTSGNSRGAEGLAGGARQFCRGRGGPAKPPRFRAAVCRSFVRSRLARLQRLRLPMASSSELAVKAAKLRDLSKQVNAEIRGLMKRQRAEVASGPPPATPWMQAVALRVFVLSGCFVDAAVEYLQSKGRQAEPLEVQAWFDALPVEDVAALSSPADGDAKAARQLAAARKFVAEKDLVTWVQQQNEAKGIAPTPSVVLDHASPAVGFSGRRNEQRRRLRRIMARWGARKRVLSGGDRLTAESFRQKAAIAQKCASRPAKPRSFSVQFSGPPGGPLPSPPGRF